MWIPDIYDMKKTIVIAEDEQINFIVLELLLSGIGDFNIIHAENGKEAVEICESDVNIDIIFMDGRMPVMDGYTAIPIIKTLRPNLMISMYTAFSDPENVRKAFDVGCDDFISKPVKKENVMGVLERYGIIDKKYDS
jgi:CheY-like chemotaxis protein